MKNKVVVHSDVMVGYVLLSQCTAVFLNCGLEVKGHMGQCKGNMVEGQRLL